MYNSPTYVDEIGQKRIDEDDDDDDEEAETNPPSSLS